MPEERTKKIKQNKERKPSPERLGSLILADLPASQKKVQPPVSSPAPETPKIIAASEAPSKSRPESVSSKKNPFANFGLSADRDYLIENMSMLVASGMTVTDTLTSIAKEVRSNRMKRILLDMRTEIDNGSSIWRALHKSGLFRDHVISLIRLGEESGKLVENLKVVSSEEQKNRMFQSKLRAAMMYPLFVLTLTVIIGVGIAWFILPKLATVFSQLRIQLPLITQILIAIGTFLGKYGAIAVPIFIAVIISLVYFIFFFSKTKIAGQMILFSAPGIKGLMKEVEIARFGYLLGTLLSAGLPVTQALDSLASASEFIKYRRLYEHMRDSVEEGNSFQKSFASSPTTDKLLPSPIQQLIVSGERSGNLSETLQKVGAMFEEKSDTTTKNLSTILEPILLVIVWLGVVAVALAVILPIYSLEGNLIAH